MSTPGNDTQSQGKEINVPLDLDVSFISRETSQSKLRGLILIIVGIIVVASVSYYFCCIWLPSNRQELTAGLVLVLFATLLWLTMSLRLNPMNFGQRKDFIDLYAKILGAVIIIMGTFFTWYNIKNTQQATVASLSLANQTLINQRANRLSEEFFKANERLMNDNINVRIAGILSLERLADEMAVEYMSAETTEQPGPQKNERLDKLRREYLRIIYVLASFIHNNAPWDKKESANLQTAQRPSDGNNSSGCNFGPNCYKLERVQTRKDIQAAMNVLGKRRLTYMKGEGDKEQRLGLETTNLRGVNLVDKENFEGASFRDSNLEKAKLRDAKLKDALFAGANLRGANFINADLEGTDFRGANLECADFTGATGLTKEQIEVADNWEKACLPSYLRHLRPDENSYPNSQQSK